MCKDLNDGARTARKAGVVTSRERSSVGSCETKAAVDSSAGATSAGVTMAERLATRLARGPGATNALTDVMNKANFIICGTVPKITLALTARGFPLQEAAIYT